MNHEAIPWKPILDDADLKGMKEKLSEIGDILLKKPEIPDENIGLMGGKTGIALFLFYYAKLTGEGKYYDCAFETLAEVFDAVNEGAVFHTFASGLSGVGWAVEHLAQQDFVDTDTDEVLSDLDPFLSNLMIEDIRDRGSYDFLHGAVGTGIYFLQRHSNEKSPHYLAQLIDGLEEKSDPSRGDGFKWESILDHEKGTKGFNLSLSHGIASIIAFLARAQEAGIHAAKASELLEGSVKYLLNQSMDPDKYKSHFPSWVREGDPPSPGRLAWCYGDLGVGTALWQAAQVAKKKDWGDRALEAVLLTTQRKDPKENSVVDVGLCHGAAGIAHVYNRMYHYTGKEILKESAIHWFRMALEMATHEDGYAGYKAWHTEKYGGWVKEAGFLEGIAGVGLALISAVSDIEPRWDRCLLLS